VTGRLACGSEKPDGFSDEPAEQVAQDGAEENRTSHSGVIVDVKLNAEEGNCEGAKAGGESERRGSVQNDDDATTRPGMETRFTG